MSVLLLISILAAVAVVLAFAAVALFFALQQPSRMLRSAQLMETAAPRSDQRRRPRLGSRRDYSALL